MKRKFLLAIPNIVAVLVLASVVLANTFFSKSVALVGGTTARMLDVMNNGNYNGSSSAVYAELCNPNDSGQTLYFGSNANVNSSAGNPLTVGQCQVIPPIQNEPTDLRTVYLWGNANQNVQITVVAK